MEKRIVPEIIALKFNDFINKKDVESLSDLMTDDHVFTNSLNEHIIGKSNNRINWANFFELFPDYWNIFEGLTVKNSTVIMQGYSVCSDERLNVKGVWTALIAGGKVKKWRVYLDTEEVRNKLGI